MILDAFETLYDRTPPACIRKIEAAALMGVFAQAFDVKTPAVEDVPADKALAIFREFSAACMEAALQDDATAAWYRERLGAEALELGRKVRMLLGVRPSNASRAARFFYRGISIELDGDISGALRFGPCYFAERYTPRDCWLMSAFDEGFMRGLSGCEQATLVFSCRLTEGAECCRAQFR